MRIRTGKDHTAYLAEWRAWLDATHPDTDLQGLRVELVQGWLSALLESSQQVSTARSNVAAAPVLNRNVDIVARGSPKECGERVYVADDEFGDDETAEEGDRE